MIPVAPLIWAVVWAMRAANKKPGVVTPSGSLHPAASAFTGQALLRVFGWLFLPIWWLLVCGGVFGNSALLEPLLLAVPTTLLCFPVWLGPASSVLPVPMGYWLIRSAGLNWTRSHPAAGAAILIARSRRLTDQEADYLTDQLRQSADCYALTWVAAGMIRANRNDLRVARLLFGIAARMPLMAGRDPALRLAREWLIADALQRGAWSEAREWTAWGLGVGAVVTGLAKVVDAVADQAPMGPSVARVFMLGRWGLARQLRGLRLPEVPTTTIGSSWQEQMGWAVATHERALQARRVEDVREACKAWDAVLEHPELRVWVRIRGQELRVEGNPVQRMVAAKEAELAELMWRERWFAPGSGAFGRVSDAAMDRAWAELKDRAKATYALGEDPNRLLFSHDAFLAWEPLRALAEAMFRDRPGDRNTIFQSMYSGSLHLAVVLYNQRGFRYFGHMVFQWLRDKGNGVMTEQLTGILDGNIRSGL